MTRIATNVESLIAQHQIAKTNQSLNQTLTQLSTGHAINRGADNPAGLVASSRISAELEALEAETRNLEREHYVANTADAALGEINTLLTEAEGMTVAAANTGAMSDAEREAYQLEIDSKLQAADRIARSTTFAGERVFNGEITLGATGVETHPDPTSEGAVTLDAVTLRSLGETDVGGTTYNLSDVATGQPLEATGQHAGDAQTIIGNAIQNVSAARGRIGAVQTNTIESNLNSHFVQHQNLSAAVSTIRDTDFASATAELTREQILTQAGTSALSIANSRPQSALALLGA